MAVAHLAFDFGLGYQGRHRVDDDDVDGAGADQHVGDLQRLLAGIRLGDQQRVGVDAELLGVFGVKRVLGVNERRDASGFLSVRDGMQRQGRFTAAFRSVDLDNPAAGEAADAKRHVERDGPGRDHLDGRAGVVAEPHDRPRPNCRSIWASAVSRDFPCADLMAPGLSFGAM